MGETTASHLSYYSSLVEVVSAAFGGKKDKDNAGPITEDLSQSAPEHFAARVNDMLSF